MTTRKPKTAKPASARQIAALAAMPARTDDPDADLEHLLHNVRGLADALIFMPDEAGTGPAVHALGRTIHDMAEQADELRVQLARN